MSYPALVSATVRCSDIARIGRIRNAKVVGSTPALGNSHLIVERYARKRFIWPSILDLSAKPLPWTKGGPNEDSNQQQPTAGIINSSVADPIFTIKNRVVTMKDLQELKKRLPSGIDIRITSKNVVKFRARFRKKGHKDVFTTKSDLKSAKQWLAEQERSAFLGELHPTAMIGNKRSFSDAIKRYKEEELPKKGKDAKNRQHHLDWFEKHLGKIKFSSIRSSDIKDAVIILENEKKPNILSALERNQRICCYSEISFLDLHKHLRCFSNSRRLSNFKI